MTFEQFLPYFFSIVFSVGGLIITIGAIRSLVHAHKVHGWQRVPVEILTFSMHTESHLMRTGSRIYGKSFTPIISYRYTINGNQYKGNRIAVTEYKGSKRLAATVLERYRNQPSPQVFYNPQHPEEAFLEAKAPGALWFLLLGFFCCSSGLLALFTAPVITAFFT